DLIYTASFTLPAEMQNTGSPPQNLTVVLKAQADGAEFTATNGFNVGWLNIRHTGKFRDRAASDEKGNHLYIDAEFEVKRSGTYHIQGSVYDDDNEGIGWAQNRVKLEPGTHMVTLRFYGKMFCDTRKNGPYILKNLVYANTGVMPGPRSQNQENLYKTGEYKYSQFTCNSFEDPLLLQKAKQMEAEAGAERN
ncbi:MAG: hypothetical protein HY042_12105, partial [Spirochaetia bacterium]|nr:hypothetical protein [Spirochaetia bacterium]